MAMGVRRSARGWGGIGGEIKSLYWDKWAKRLPTCVLITLRAQGETTRQRGGHGSQLRAIGNAQGGRRKQKNSRLADENHMHLKLYFL